MAWFISAILDAGVATAGVVICSILVFVNVEGVFFFISAVVVVRLVVP